MQAGELRLSRNACGKARPLRIRPCLPAGNPHATLDKAPAISGASPSVHLLKKIGRAAPVGLGYREKKRYRSPLVSL